MNDHELCEQLVALEPRLFMIAKQYLSCYADQQDAVQECLYKAWKYRDSIQEPKCLRSWVIRILMNECVNIQRKQIKISHFNVEQAQRGESENMFNHVISKVDLENAFHSIKEIERQIIYLHYYKGYMLPEIADMTKLSHGAVQSKLYRSLKKLSTCLIAS